MKLSHKELVRISFIFMSSSDPLVYVDAYNKIRANVKTNERFFDQKWYQEADRLYNDIFNSLLCKALYEED